MNTSSLIFDGYPEELAKMVHLFSNQHTHLMINKNNLSAAFLDVYDLITNSPDSLARYLNRFAKKHKIGYSQALSTFNKSNLPREVIAAQILSDSVWDIIRETYNDQIPKNSENRGMEHLDELYRDVENLISQVH